MVRVARLSRHERRASKMRDAVPQKELIIIIIAVIINNNNNNNNNVTTLKSKPSLEIYRPPGGRTEGTTANTTNPRLNVHAKGVHYEARTIRILLSLGQMLQSDLRIHLQHSKSSGNVHRYLYAQQQQQIQHTFQATSSSDISSLSERSPFDGICITTVTSARYLSIKWKYITWLG